MNTKALKFWNEMLTATETFDVIQAAMAVEGLARLHPDDVALRHLANAAAEYVESYSIAKERDEEWDLYQST